MAKDASFTDIFANLVDNFERVLKVINGVPHLTTVIAVLIVLCLGSAVGYFLWHNRQRAMGRLFFVCLALLCGFGVLGAIMQPPPDVARSNDYFIVGTLTGLQQYDPQTGVESIKHRITANVSPTPKLLLFDTNNGISPSFQWVLRVDKVTCRTTAYIDIRDETGRTLLQRLYVPLFTGTPPTGAQSINVTVDLAKKQAIADIDGRTQNVFFEAPDYISHCSTAGLGTSRKPPRRTGSLFGLIGRAFAQARTPQEEKAFRYGLGAENPTLRSQSRTELARRGAEALPWIERVIADKASSDLLLAGVVGALVDMQVQRKQLSAATVTRLLDFLDDKNNELRRNARDVLRAIADAGIVADLAKRYSTAKEKVPHGTDAVQLAFAVLDINYAYGVRKYFEFDKNENDIGAYRDAIAAFRAIVAAADAVEGADKARFMRGHWGQIVAKHHRYWTLPAATDEAKALRAELMGHFKAMVAVENAKDGEGRLVYRYRHHIDTARRCLSEYARACMKGAS